MGRSGYCGGLEGRRFRSRTTPLAPWPFPLTDPRYRFRWVQLRRQAVLPGNDELRGGEVLPQPARSQRASATTARPAKPPANRATRPAHENQPTRTKPRHTPTQPAERPAEHQTRPPAAGTTPPRHAHGDQRSAATAHGARPRRAHGCARPPSAGMESPRRLAPGDGTRDNVRAAAGGVPDAPAERWGWTCKKAG